jgi:hypothetical protein
VRIFPVGGTRWIHALKPRLRSDSGGSAEASAPAEAVELSGTKKDRECLRGLDFNVQGTPRERAAILRLALASVKDIRGKVLD